MTTSDQLVPLLDKHGLSRLASTILGLAKPALMLKKRTIAERRPAKPKWFGLVRPKDEILERPAPVTSGASKFGGYPDFPLEAKWPKGEQGHLDFICQISCAEVHRAQPIAGIPTVGMMYFFFDASAESSGWDYAEAGQNLVVHHASSAPPGDDATQRQAAKVVLPEYPIDLVPVATVPDHDSPEIDTVGLSRKELAAFERFAESITELSGRSRGTGRHQFGGYAMRIQGDVRAEFEAFDGFKFYKGSLPDDAAWRRAHELAPNWSLLLQVDSDDDLKLMWGDAGMLYYGIRNEALDASRFGESKATVQCF
jgi:uncharacterized protein YwqG